MLIGQYILYNLFLTRFEKLFFSKIHIVLTFIMGKQQSITENV